MNAGTTRTNPAGAGADKDVANAMRHFEALPAKTKELAQLQAEVAKTSGPTALVLQKKIGVLGAG